MIRPMTKEDLAIVNEIYNDAILTTTAIYKYEPETIEQREQWFSVKKDNDDPLFVYEENGEVVGFATFGPFRAYPAYKYTIEHSVYVHKDHHRKGIGTKLMKHLIAEAERREVKTMVACIDAENKGSILSHEKLGFYYTGTIKNSGYKFGRWLDLVFLQLDLKGPVNPKEN
ncbi:N-acetyltransferase family protein [Lysinibacillus telephonicus]|uniref:GNAT family N-acetyltransferase n=1 Tax=Lysinibacillus telephonicus TaxID=1714840 RepID=UPI0031FDD508